MNSGTSEEDLKYSKILRQIDVHRPRIVHFREPRNIVSVRARQMVETRVFRAFSFLCVIINVGFMLADHADASPGFEKLMVLQSQCFFFEIVLENVICVVGYGLLVLVYDPWKRFDLVIMLGSATSYFFPDSKISTGIQVRVYSSDSESFH